MAGRSRGVKIGNWGRVCEEARPKPSVLPEHLPCARRQAPSTRPSSGGSTRAASEDERGTLCRVVRSLSALRTHSRAASPPAAFDLQSQALRSTRWSRACVEFTDFSSTCGASADNVCADEVSEGTVGGIANEYVPRAPSHVRTHVHSRVLYGQVR